MKKKIIFAAVAMLLQFATANASEIIDTLPVPGENLHVIPRDSVFTLLFLTTPRDIDPLPKDMLIRGNYLMVLNRHRDTFCAYKVEQDEVVVVGHFENISKAQGKHFLKDSAISFFIIGNSMAVMLGDVDVGELEL